MKKYRLIKALPDCNIGTIFEWNEKANWYIAEKSIWVAPDRYITFSKGTVEESPEWFEEVKEYPLGTKVLNTITNAIYTKKEDGWYKPAEKTSYTDEMIANSKTIKVITEKIKEKEYKILEFTTVSTLILRLKPDSFYYTDGELYPFSFEEFYCRNEVKSINKICRLSDGVKFKLGDKVQTNDKTFKGIIEEFKIYNSTILAFLETPDLEENKVWVALELLQHYKEPIFTTEDGYECTLDDKVFGVLPKANWQTNYYGGEGIPVEWLFKSGDGDVTKNTPWKYFKTKENAEKYIHEYKPEFCRSQLLDFILQAQTLFENPYIKYTDENYRTFVEKWIKSMCR